MATHFELAGRLVAGVMSLVLCCGVIGAQIGAIGAIFHVFLGIDVTLGVILGCGIAIIYTTAGGIRAVVLTDVIQFTILTIGIPLLLVFGIIYLGGIESFVTEVPGDRWNVPGPQLIWVSLISLFLAFFLGKSCHHPMSSVSSSATPPV